MVARERGGAFGLVFLLGFLLWMLNHPYRGIWHDAHIYALLAAHWMDPRGFAGDLFFSFGSQGAFSLFTPLFGNLVSWLGLSRAAWWVVFVGGLLWIAACLALARTMLGTGFAARFAILLGAVMVVSYSPNGSTFVLGEYFATARSWAIPLGLASVAALAAKRPWWALGLSLAATALHPLHGIWAIALWALARMQITAAAVMALLPVGLVTLLGLINLELPYLRLMTGDWLEFARGAPDILFRPPLQSRLPVYSGVLIALWLGARHGATEWRGMYLRLLLLGVGGMALALLASYRFPLEIVVQGQAWRVMALLIPMAAVAIVDVGRRCWMLAAGRLLVAVVVVLASMGSAWLLGGLCAVAIGSLLPRVWIRHAEAFADQRRHWLGAALMVVALSVLPNLLASWEVAGSQWLNPWWSGAEWLRGLVAGGSWQFAAVLALVLGLLDGDDSRDTGRNVLRRSAVATGFMAAGLAAIVTINHWDRRTESHRISEACYLDARCPPHPFRQWIVPGTTVFWPGRELMVWYRLGTASYFGEIQQTGKVFSSAKFYESQRRHARIAEGTDPRHLCTDTLLDWVVLHSPIPGLTAQSEWQGAHLYSCAGLRTVAPKLNIGVVAQ